MTWSYSGDPASSDKDRVRFLVGDTDTNDQLVTDEEINYLVSLRGSAERAAQDTVRTIMAKLSREVDYALGPEKVSASQKLENYKKLLDSLKEVWIASNAGPIWTGATSVTGGTDIFGIGMHDNEGVDDGLSD